jgi:hypothetical protein
MNRPLSTNTARTCRFTACGFGRGHLPDDLLFTIEVDAAHFLNQ